MSEIDLDRLRRLPDMDSPNLVAVDATDRLILELAESAILSAPKHVVTVGDRYGALTLGALALGAEAVSSWQDSMTSRLALENNRVHQHVSKEQILSASLVPEVFLEAKVVLLQLPKDLATLDMLARMIATFASSEVKLFAGGRNKYMTPRMNEVLGTYFGNVGASRAKQKSRVLIASGAVKEAREWSLPYSEHYDRELQINVCSLPGVFAAGKIDIGTRFLLSFLKEMRGEQSVADLGCGSGVLATAWARENPDGKIVATDTSELAALSAKRTLDRNVKSSNYEARQDHGLRSQPDHSLDLILLNPPFHQGGGIVRAAGNALFQEAARTLRPGGHLLTVYNSHLPHRVSLESIVGKTVQLGRNNKFTVTCSTAG